MLSGEALQESAVCGPLFTRARFGLALLPTQYLELADANGRGDLELGEPGGTPERSPDLGGKQWRVLTEQRVYGRSGVVSDRHIHLQR